MSGLKSCLIDNAAHGVHTGINRTPTVIQIQKSTECPNFYILTTEKGKTVQANLNNGLCTVYIKQNGSRNLSYGKTFSSVAEAAESYKRQDIKSALRMLAEI